jgi:hypothetical protein
MNWSTLLQIGAIAAQTVVAVWYLGRWEAKISIQLKTLNDSVGKLQMKEESWLKREDFLLQVSNRNSEMSSVWKSLNDLRDKFNDCRAKANCNG